MYNLLCCYVHCSLICSVLLILVPLNRCKLLSCATPGSTVLAALQHSARPTEHSNSVHILLHTSIGRANTSHTRVGVLLSVCNSEAQAQLVRSIDSLMRINTAAYEQHLFVVLCASERHDASRLSELYEIFHLAGRLASANLTRAATRTVLAVLLIENTAYDTDALNAALATRHPIVTACDYFLRLSNGVSPLTPWLNDMVLRLRWNANIGFVSGSCTVPGHRVLAIVPAVARRTSCNELFHRDHVVATMNSTLSRTTFPVHMQDRHIHYYMRHLYAKHWHINIRWRRILTEVVFVERLPPASVFDDYFSHSEVTA
jgi:hypothetical protein